VIVITEPPQVGKDPGNLRPKPRPGDSTTRLSSPRTMLAGRAALEYNAATHVMDRGSGQ